jgi:hypothetical protein
MLNSALSFARMLILSWLVTRGGCDQEGFTFDNDEIGDIPLGYTAVVTIELRKKL